MQIDAEAITATLQNAVLTFPNIVAAVVIFVAMFFVAGIAAKIVRRACKRHQLRPEATLILTRATRWGIVAIGLFWALDRINFNVTAFIAAMGILGFTIGFALQDISKNFVAGILLLWQHPFNIDDVISVSGYTGKVTDITVRATEMRTFDGLQVLIPNADVYISPIVNYTKAAVRRVELRVGVSYSADLEKATRVALETINSLPDVLKGDRAPSVVFDRFGATSVDFAVYYWIDTSTTEFPAAQDQGLKAVKAAFQREGIAIPTQVPAMILPQSAQ